MTNTQTKKVELIKKLFINHLFNETYEVKTCEVKPLSSTDLVEIYMVSGLIGDEGTYAELFARDRIHAFVSPRGQITYYDIKAKKIKVFNTNKQSIYTLICASNC